MLCRHLGQPLSVTRLQGEPHLLLVDDENVICICYFRLTSFFEHSAYVGSHSLYSGSAVTRSVAQLLSGPIKMINSFSALPTQLGPAFWAIGLIAALGICTLENVLYKSYFHLPTKPK